ncbi:phosphocarrier protein FPr [Pseudonocardia eucalypti]|nr:phosphocarrier protein FPr [Pseudonocardia eucalypti]
MSHSRALARAAVALAQEMLHGRQVRIAIAAGLDENTFGTDATQIVEAITDADQGEGVVVLMDLGSAVLSAELALELLDEPHRDGVLLCPAPLVEGLVVAAVAAAGGADRHEVAAEALAALAGKAAQLPTAAPEEHPARDTAKSGDLSGVFTVSNAHGLHARPAARLVQEVRRLDAEVRLRNRTTGTPWVPAGSLSKVATLGALHGHEVEIEVSGNQAREALSHILALAARNFDETDEAPAEVAPAILSREPRAASPGVGIGPARSTRFGPIEVPDETADDPATEWRRLGKALAAVRRNVRQLRVRTARELSEDEAAIFDAHLLLLDDAELLDQARERINGGLAAAPAWHAAVGRLHDELAALTDPYLQARAADVRAVGDQVLRSLLGITGPAAQGAAGVLVAGDLTPAEAAELQPDQVVAVLMAFSSPNAHNAILLRAKGIPTVVGAGQAVLNIEDGELVAVDGGRGEYVVNPPAEVREAYAARAAELAERSTLALKHAAAPAHTRDGAEVLVAANIGAVSDARVAAEMGADLAGLVRTEFLFMGRAAAPDIDEQEAVYREIAEALGGRRITLRTLDIGGDKPLDFLPSPGEANPFLGVRGIRLSLNHPQLLTDQLVAIVRVAHDTPVSVMFPMVSNLDELLAARRLLDDAIKQVGRGQPDELQVGIMIEVPGAALKAATFALHVDFFSIGTNDLTQYAMAADRNNDAVAEVGDPFDPGVLQLIEATCRGAGDQALVAVCGEIASDERAAALLVGLGVRELSVTPRAIPGTKQTVRSLDSQHATTLAKLALHADSAATAREIVTPLTTVDHRA